MKAILQRDFKDCGVTCLKYLIEYYKGYVPLEKLRDDTKTNQSGTTAYHLVETLKKYGFDSYGLKVEKPHLKELVFPAIVHFVLENGMHHFVILERVRKNEVLIMDPAVGKRKLSWSKFSAYWDGIVLLAIPNRTIPKLEKEKSMLSVLARLCKREKTLLFKIILFSLFVSFLTIILSFYLKIGMEGVFAFSRNTLYRFIFCFGCLTLLKILLDFGKNYWQVYLDRNIEIDYLYAFLTHLFRLPTEKFLTYHEGEIFTRVEEAREIKDLFESVCITFFLEGLLGVFSIVILFWMSSRLTIFIVIGMMIYILFTLFTSKSFYHLVLENMEVEKKWNESLMEHIRVYLTMKHLNQTNNRLEVLEGNLCRTTKTKMHQQLYAMIHGLLKKNFLEILFFGILTYGILLVGENKLSLLDFVTFQSLYLYFVNPLKELADIGPKFYYMKGILQKISETFALQEEVDTETTTLIHPEIKVEKLTYSYNKITNVFEEKNFSLKKGEHVFLDGPSGCGKSTFCKILHQDILEYEGEILLDNKNLRDCDISVVRSSILYLSQRENLISGTIKENILFGGEETDYFWEVVKVCELDEIVKKRPLRYESTIHNESLSGGEKQRIMLARILNKNANVYILDECLSEVEDDLEVKIIRNIREFLKGKTLLYISHRDHSKEFERRILF